MSDPPPIAAKADDLEAIKKAVDDAASVGGGLWLSYLFVLFYFAVAAGAVTHADLFLENPVKLPFLNIELPLLAFFFLAPILFIIMHAYTLVHLVMLTEKGKRFHEAVHDVARSVNPARRENLQWQLPSNIFIQFLVGPEKIRRGLFGSSLRAIAWITLVLAPILLLLMMQVQFLPFHSPFITWTQRIALLVDLILLGWLWRKVLSGHELGGPFRAFRIWLVLGVVLSFLVLLFSWVVATFQGEWQQERLATWRFAHVSQPLDQANGEAPDPQEMLSADWTATFQDRAASFVNWMLAQEASIHNWIFNSEVDPTTRRRRLPFSSTLVLTGFNILEGLGVDDPKKEEWRDFMFRARGRDLKGARFDFASLPRVDFNGAHLEGASLDEAQLDRTSFDGTHLEGASLNSAQLQGASLNRAQLQGASLEDAQLQGASLNRAQLQGASLEDAQLRGASLEDAQLQGASLDDAQLQGASFRGAELQGASLVKAQLQNALLNFAQLQGARLNDGQLQGASLYYTQLQGASLVHAQLQGARLEGAQLEGASLYDAQLQGASLVEAQLQGASLRYAQLQGASLQGAQLQGSWLEGAQLQGTSFASAVMDATDLSDTYLWRTNRPTPPSEVSAIRTSSGSNAWRPEWKSELASLEYGNPKPWDEKNYQVLRETMAGLPAGKLREDALERIQSLDCLSSDKTLASCDPDAPAPPEDIMWRKTLETAGLNEEAYEAALVRTLKDLVCFRNSDAIHVVRGAAFLVRLQTLLIRELNSKHADRGAIDLINDLTNKNSKNCPVSASLTDADRTNLLHIKPVFYKAGN